MAHIPSPRPIAIDELPESGLDGQNEVVSGIHIWSIASVLLQVVCPVLAIHGTHDECGMTRHPEMIGPMFQDAVRIDVPFVASMANGVGVVQQRLQLVGRVNFLHFDFVPSLDGG
jgi:hypothetical protein